MSQDPENEIVATVTFIHHKIGFKEPPFSLMDFCEAFPVYELHPASLPKSYNGEIMFKGSRKIIRYQSATSPAKNRFTIAHEIGHGFMHEDLDFSCHISGAFSMFDTLKAGDREWEADYFAAELIMPIPTLQRLAGKVESMDPDQLRAEKARLADIFGVSKDAMRGRIKDLIRLRQCEEDLNDLG